MDYCCFSANIAPVPILFPGSGYKLEGMTKSPIGKESNGVDTCV